MRFSSPHLEQACTAMPFRQLSQSKRRAKNALLIGLGSAFLFIPAAEVTLRLLCTYCTWTEENQGHFASPYDLRMGSWYYNRPPNTVTRYQQKEFAYDIKTNSLGFRDMEHPVSKPPGEIRILAVGDSFTEGQGARFEQTWLNQLGRALGTEHAGSRFRMINAGTVGSDPFFGYRNLVDRLLVFKPDIVLLVVNHSDVMEVVLRGGMERFLPDGTVKSVDPADIVSPTIARLYEWSHFARFIFLELFDYTHHMIPRTKRDQLAQQALEKIQDLVLDYGKLLQSKDIAFSIIIHPFRSELRRNQYDELDILREFALHHRVNVIDAKPYLYQKLLDHGHRLEEIYWPSDNHFTEVGYRYFAEAIQLGLAPTIAAIKAEASEGKK